jgi:hypothetical protein
MGGSVARKGRRRQARRQAAVVNNGSPPPRVREFVPWSDPDRPVVPLADYIATDDLATAQRVVAVRRGFLEAMLGDLRVLRLLEKWIIGSPLKSRLVVASMEKLLRTECGFTWPWCVVEILSVLKRMLRLKIGDPLQAMRSAEAGVQAPSLKIQFETYEGESTDEAFERLTWIYRECIAILAEAEAAVRGGNRRAPKDDAYLKTWGRWFYERHVAKPSKTLYRIAEENGGQDSRKRIRVAIRDAGRLLELGGYAIAGPPGKIRPRVRHP